MIDLLQRAFDEKPRIRGDTLRSQSGTYSLVEALHTTNEKVFSRLLMALQ